MGAIVRGHMPRAGDMADLRSERSERKDAFARKLFAQRLFSRRRRVRRLCPRGDIDRGIRGQEHIRFDGQRGYVLRHRRIRSSVRQYRRSDVRAIPRIKTVTYFYGHYFCCFQINYQAYLVKKSLACIVWQRVKNKFILLVPFLA